MGRRRTASGKKWRAKVARVAKNVTLRSSETKRYQTTGTNSAAGGDNTIIPLFSNGGSSSLSSGPFYDMPLRFIDPGDGITSRTGNRITLKGMHVYMQVEQDPTFLGNTHVRVSVVWIDPNQSPTALAFGNFYNNGVISALTTTQTPMRHGTDNDAIINKVIYDRVFALRTGEVATTSPDNTQQVSQKLIKFHIPFHNKLYQFVNSSTGIQGEKEDLVFIMTAYTPGRDGTNRVANVRLQRKIYFKDP